MEKPVATIDLNEYRQPLFPKNNQAAAAALPKSRVVSGVTVTSANIN